MAVSAAQLAESELAVFPITSFRQLERARSREFPEIVRHTKNWFEAYWANSMLNARHLTQRTPSFFLLVFLKLSEFRGRNLAMNNYFHQLIHRTKYGILVAIKNGHDSASAVADHMDVSQGTSRSSTYSHLASLVSSGLVQFKAELDDEMQAVRKYALTGTGNEVVRKFQETEKLLANSIEPASALS